MLAFCFCLAGCGGNTEHPGAAGKATTSTTTGEPATTTTALQSFRWADMTVPPGVCPHLSQPVKLSPITADSGRTIGSATIPAPAGLDLGISDVVIDETAVYYGTLSRGLDVAAVYVWCTNTGGTADGQIQSSLVVYRAAGGQPSLVATLTPQQPSAPDGHHVAFFDGSGVAISGTTITTKELWYGGQDATCCPSGRATTVWTFDGSSFSPQTTIDARPTGT